MKYFVQAYELVFPESASWCWSFILAMIDAVDPQMLFDYTITEYKSSTHDVGYTTISFVLHAYEGGAAPGASVPLAMPGRPGGGGRSNEE